MKRRCESLYSTLPLNRFSPHLPGSLESFCIRLVIVTPAEAICNTALQGCRDTAREPFPRVLFDSLLRLC